SLDSMSFGCLGGGPGTVLGGVAWEATEETEHVFDVTEALCSGEFTILAKDAREVRSRRVRGGSGGGVGAERLLAFHSRGVGRGCRGCGWGRLRVRGQGGQGLCACWFCLMRDFRLVLPIAHVDHL